MKVLAFAATNSKNSINKQLVTHASEVLKSDFDTNADIEILDLNDYEMPIYSPDREKADGVHPLAQKFFDKITDADALIISFAEYNGNYTSAYKNVFDWASRIKMQVFQDKPTLHMSASLGPNGGASVISIANNSASFFKAELKASFSVGPFSEKFDSEKGVLKDAELSEKLRSGVEALVDAHYKDVKIAS
ncbi:MAG: NAD(P)H-dependent oxidoreductase [Lentilitoribacter sp.]